MSNDTAIKAPKKKMVRGETSNQLAPFKYQWAWDAYLNANKNHWTPDDIAMHEDVQQYQKLTATEKHVYDNVLAYLTTSDIMAMRNIAIAVLEKVTAPEVQQYLARQAYEETIHTWTYQHCIETIGLDPDDIYNRYITVPAIAGKIEISAKYLNAGMTLSPDDMHDDAKLLEFLYGYIFFAVIFEGSWFYNGFTPIYALQRQNKMKRTAEQLQYIQRDEAMHASIGIRIIKEIMLENPQIKLDNSVLADMFESCLEAEKVYANYILDTPILGYTAQMHVDSYMYMANRRCEQLGITFRYKDAPKENPVPWLDEQTSIRKEKNFFESRVTEYASAGLDWD